MYVSNAGDQAVNRTHASDYTNQRVIPLGHAADKYFFVTVNEPPLRKRASQLFFLFFAAHLKI